MAYQELINVSKDFDMLWKRKYPNTEVFVRCEQVSDISKELSVIVTLGHSNNNSDYIPVLVLSRLSTLNCTSVSLSSAAGKVFAYLSDDSNYFYKFILKDGEVCEQPINIETLRHEVKLISPIQVSMLLELCWIGILVGSEYGININHDVTCIMRPLIELN